MAPPGSVAQETNNQLGTVNVAWDPAVSCSPVLDEDSTNGPPSEIRGENTRCIIQMLAGQVAQGSFTLPFGVTSATINGWWNRYTGKPNVIVGNGPETLRLVPVDPAQATNPCGMFPLNCDVNEWRQFGAHFDLEMGMSYNNLTFQTEYQPGAPVQVAVMFQNLSVSYDPTGSPPSQTGQSSSNETIQTTIVTTSAFSQEPSSAIGSASIAGGSRTSTAAVVVPAVLCAVFGIAALAFGTLWWLQRRRSLAPSAAYRANPETAWVPIDEKRQPTPGPSN